MSSTRPFVCIGGSGMRLLSSLKESACILSLLVEFQTFRMLFVIAKMATNGIKSNSSDFSIDHILNRAGDRFIGSGSNCDRCETASGASSSGDESSGCDFTRNVYRNELLSNERLIQVPTFDWLSYTRYNMPRIPRPIKGPVKRTPGRLPRIPFTPYQLNELENAYKSAMYLSTEKAIKLAKRLELTGVRVKMDKPETDGRKDKQQKVRLV